VVANFVVYLNQTDLNLAGCPVAARVVVARDPSFTGAVALSISGIPSDVTATITPQTVSFDSANLAAVSTLTLTTNASSLAPARITVTGTSGGFRSATTVTIQGGCFPFNLVWNHTDENGFPVDPQWEWQLGHGRYSSDYHTATPDYWSLCGRYPAVAVSGGQRLPPPRTDYCTNQAINLDNSGVCSGRYPFVNPIIGLEPKPLGHINWPWVATYSGLVGWEEHTPSYADDDYNIRLATPEFAGQTVTGYGTLGVEFDADETVDHFLSPWWSAFHAAVDNGFEAAAQMINGHEGVVEGMVTLDWYENAHAESHPAFAVAIDTQPNFRRNPADDAWAFFARNWGNEGGCAQNNYVLDTQILSIRIPWWPGATGVTLDRGRSSLDGGTLSTPGSNGIRVPYAAMYTLDAKPTVGAILTVTLPRVQSRGFVDGEVHLDWKFPPCTNCPSHALPPITGRLAHILRQPDLTPVRLSFEASLARNWSHFTPDQRRAITMGLADNPLGHVHRVFYRYTPADISRSHSPIAVRRVADPRKALRNRIAAGDYCSTLTAHPAQARDACATHWSTGGLDVRRLVLLPTIGVLLAALATAGAIKLRRGRSTTS
jgi:hypothetical protein